MTTAEYASIPMDALYRKFEETALPEDEDYLYKYNREVLKDRSPDDPTFEHEKPRRNVDSVGFLNRRYLGHRSGEGPDHSERFFELTDKEPRRYATDPDYNKFNDHSWGRQRMVESMMGREGGDHITGGGVREWTTNKWRTDIQKAVQPRVKIFTTTKDNRTIRQGPAYDPRNRVELQYGETNRFADLVKADLHMHRKYLGWLDDYQNRKSVVGHGFVPDHVFKIANYGRGTARVVGKNQIVGSQKDYVKVDQGFGTQKRTAAYCAMRGLMEQAAAKGKLDMAAIKDGDIDYDEACRTMNRKTAEYAKDIAKIFKETYTDHRERTQLLAQIFQKSTSQDTDLTKIFREVVENLENMDPSRQDDKSAPFKFAVVNDTRKAMDNATTQKGVNPTKEDDITPIGKTNMGQAEGASRNAYVNVDGKQMQTASYKNNKKVYDVEEGRRYVAYEKFKKDAKEMSMRKGKNPEQRSVNQGLTAEDVSFGMNQGKDRRIGRIYKKRMQDHLETDDGAGERIISDY